MTAIIQGTPEWHAVRCGKVTASRIADLTAKIKSGPSASRTTYMGELICERLTGVVSADGFKSGAMQWGTDNEPQARLNYAFDRNVEIEEIGFVDHPTIKMAGASPDGLVGTDGLAEFKCPNTATHLETLRTRNVPSVYVKQMYWQMSCTGRQWNDFTSYDPRLPEQMQMITVRLPRNPEIIAGLEAEVSAFIAELDATVAELRTLYLKDAA
jgi:putative phage-type endonuclease